MLALSFVRALGYVSTMCTQSLLQCENVSSISSIFWKGIYMQMLLNSKNQHSKIIFVKKSSVLYSFKGLTVRLEAAE